MTLLLRIIIWVIIFSLTLRIIKGNEVRGNETGLGFLVKLKTIKVASLTKIQKTKLVANIGFSLAEATAELLLSNTEITKLNTMKIITQDVKEGVYVKRHVNFIIKEYAKITTELAMLLSYTKQGANTKAEFSCQQTMPGISKDFIKAYANDLTTTIGLIDLTRTKEQMITTESGDSEYELLIINLFRIREILSDFRKVVQNYAYLLDNLTAYRLTPEALWYLQQSTCVEDFEDERYNIDTCDKVTNGVECTLTLYVYKGVKEVQLYVPVSYKGYQVSVPINSYITRDENHQWNTLHCKQEVNDKDIIDINMCTTDISMTDCLQNLEKGKYDEIKHTCTFEHKTPLSVVQTEDGILVQSDKVTVREKEDQTKMIILDKKVPYLLKTDKPVSVIYQNAEEIYEPILKGTVRQILYSQMTEYQLNTLSKMQILKNLDLQYVYHEHVHVIGLVIIGVFCISVLFICICKKNSLLIYIQRKSEERENARRRSQNYRANRIMLNKVSQQASNL